MSLKSLRNGLLTPQYESRVPFTHFCRYSNNKCPLLTRLGGGVAKRGQCPLFLPFFLKESFPYHHLLLLFTRMLHDLELKKSFNRADVEKCPIQYFTGCSRKFLYLYFISHLGGRYNQKTLAFVTLLLHTLLKQQSSPHHNQRLYYNALQQSLGISGHHRLHNCCSQVI